VAITHQTDARKKDQLSRISDRVLFKFLKSVRFLLRFWKKQFQHLSYIFQLLLAKKKKKNQASNLLPEQCLDLWFIFIIMDQIIVLLYSNWKKLLNPTKSTRSFSRTEWTDSLSNTNNAIKYISNYQTGSISIHHTPYALALFWYHWETEIQEEKTKEWE